MNQIIYIVGAIVIVIALTHARLLRLASRRTAAARDHHRRAALINLPALSKRRSAP